MDKGLFIHKRLLHGYRSVTMHSCQCFSFPCDVATDRCRNIDRSLMAASRRRQHLNSPQDLTTGR